MNQAVWCNTRAGIASVSDSIFLHNFLLTWWFRRLTDVYKLPSEISCFRKELSHLLASLKKYTVVADENILLWGGDFGWWSRATRTDNKLVSDFKNCFLFSSLKRKTYRDITQYYLSKEMWSVQGKIKLFDFGRIQTHYLRILITDDQMYSLGQCNI